MSRAPKNPRRDAWHASIPPGDPRRALIRGWLLADGEQSARQRLLSELLIASPSDPAQPVGTSAFYDGLNFWDAQERFARMQSKAVAQATLEAEQRGMSVEQREELIDRHFIELAADAGDTPVYLELRKLRLLDIGAKVKGRIDAAKLAQKDRDLALAERRVVLLETNAAAAKAALETVRKTGGLSPEALAQIEEAAALL